ncbi:hypothetical protein [Gluconobacter cerinus]|uniref:hypothetical protein n=1 Tax=Gluconobacter cerinus TaxID=38307 RepID=UPI0020114FCF|nr:hypothetical protein [Gluconobacter cerinus]
MIPTELVMMVSGAKAGSSGNMAATVVESSRTRSWLDDIIDTACCISPLFTLSNS